MENIKKFETISPELEEFIKSYNELETVFKTVDDNLKELLDKEGSVEKVKEKYNNPQGTLFTDNIDFIDTIKDIFEEYTYNEKNGLKQSIDFDRNVYSDDDIMTFSYETKDSVSSVRYIIEDYGRIYED